MVLLRLTGKWLQYIAYRASIGPYRQLQVQLSLNAIHNSFFFGVRGERNEHGMVLVAPEHATIGNIQCYTWSLDGRYRRRTWSSKSGRSTTERNRAAESVSIAKVQSLITTPAGSTAVAYATCEHMRRPVQENRTLSFCRSLLSQPDAFYREIKPPSLS